MKISMNTVVTIDFELKDSDGQILEKSNQPISYLHGGFDNIFSKIEEALHGKDKGDTVEVSPNQKMLLVILMKVLNIESADKFPENVKIGMQFEGEDESGEVIVFTVTDVADGKVVVDGNYPWAGQRVLFKATVIDVRSAYQKEIEHKHANGLVGNAITDFLTLHSFF